MIHDRSKAPRPTTPRVLPEDKFKLESYQLAEHGESIVMLPPEARVLQGDNIGGKPVVWTMQPAIPRNNTPVPRTFFVCEQHQAFAPPPENAQLIGFLSTRNVFIFAIGPDESEET